MSRTYRWSRFSLTRVQRKVDARLLAFTRTLTGLREALRRAGIGASSIIALAPLTPGSCAAG